MAKLTPKQKRFAQEYLIDLNATQAAIRSGYSSKGADVAGIRNLANPIIQATIQKAQVRQAKKAEVTAEMVIAELKKLAFSDLGQFVDWGPGGITLRESSTLTPEQRAAVSEVAETTTQFGGSKRIKLHSKEKALELLGKHLGIFVDRVENTVIDKTPSLTVVVQKAEEGE